MARAGSMHSGLGGALRSYSESATQHRLEVGAEPQFKVERSNGSLVSRVAPPKEDNKHSAPLQAERKGGLWRRCELARLRGEALHSSLLPSHATGRSSPRTCCLFSCQLGRHEKGGRRAQPQKDGGVSGGHAEKREGPRRAGKRGAVITPCRWPVTGRCTLDGGCWGLAAGCSPDICRQIRMAILTDSRVARG